MLSSRPRLTLLLTTSLLALSGPARATLSDSWDQKFEGIKHLLRTGVDANGRYQIYHLALVDLTNPHVYVRGVLNHDTWGGAKERVSGMAKRHGAALAVNGDYWDWGWNDPSQGTAAVEGVCYRAHPDRSAIAFSKDLKQAEVGQWGTWPIPAGPPDDCPAWIHNAIGAGPQFIFNGVAKWTESPNPNDSSMVDINDDTWFGAEAKHWDTNPDPNTAVGISADGKTLILVTCDGRNAGGADGCRMMTEMVSIMKEFGAYNAVKLDSGGSTTFYYDGAVRNNPSDGSERYVADSLVVLSTKVSCNADLNGGVTVIDDGSACFNKVTSYWWTTSAGTGGSSVYTWATDKAAPETSGSWSYTASKPGRYKLEAFIPDVQGLSHKAPYVIPGPGGAVTKAVDQEAARGTWIALGHLDVTAAGKVRLDDNSGEPYGAGNNRKIIFDALRFSWAPLGSADSGPASPDAAVVAKDAGAADLPPGVDGGVAPGDGPASAGDAGAGDGASSGADAGGTVLTEAGTTPRGGDDSGCGCRLGATEQPSGLALLLFGLLLWPLRRRRH